MASEKKTAIVDAATDQDASDTAISSLGVQRVAALSKVLTLTDRICIFGGVFLVAYVYGLDGTLRYTYQPLATASFHSLPLQATVNVIRGVVAAAVQPTAAKVADVFGRVELVCLSALFYLVGTIVEATARNISTFIGGNVIYQIGFTSIIFLVEVIIADITSTRTRLFFSYIPALPFIINTWVSGNVASSVLASTSWRWGIGMWAIVFPVCALPLVLSLTLASRRAQRKQLAPSFQSVFRRRSPLAFAAELFWLVDVIGLLLIIAALVMILVPLTIAGGFSSKWHSPGIIAPLAVGVCCLPAFVLWELRAPHPLAPFSFMKRRAVWAPFGIALSLNFAYAIQADFLFTVLQVAFDFSTTTATRVLSLYSFCSVIVGTALGLVVIYIRRLKVFVVAGTALYMVAFGLLIHFRGANMGSAGRSGMIGAQVLLGIAGGLFPYATQAILQVGLLHEHMAVMTGIFLATYNIGSALGNTVSGAIWTQLLPKRLDQTLATVNSSLAAPAYEDPFTSVVAAYPMGTPERTAVIEAYQSVQRILCITGVVVCVPLFCFSLLLPNPRLNNDQSLAKKTSSTSLHPAEEENHAAHA
ncbi:hypothetical protein CDD82_1103 [Ophiocordyceps australis]|uniref:Major facilitator superfamily (MFS) profile domain-containing protein n=1 Tax=Ophiocordyceps australis TaxID=1399860 RepID=A0A2C5YLD3_9HYPO|nr:hypothetical protein CDD82_1103 [Ophiocordyceps australis]